MSDYEPVLHLDVPHDLPADELWDAVEFIYLTLLLYGISLDSRLFQSVDHPHIQGISTYIQENIKETGIEHLSKEQLQHRAKKLIEKLKTYCVVSLEESRDGVWRLVITIE